MRMRRWLCILVSLMAGTAASQDKPDFTGRWVPVNPPDSAGIAHELFVSESFEVPVKVLTVQRRSKSGVTFDSYQVGLEGGTIGVIWANGRGTGPNGQIVSTRFSVRWEGEKLAIKTGSYSGPRESEAYSEHDEVWSLDAQGTLVMTVTDRRSGTEPRTAQLTYRRP
jgi:hypothetical protein